MEKVSETIKSTNGDNVNFFNYVFNFDDENKNNMMNMIQYTLLAIIPVLITLKVTKHIFPEEDESKGSLEIFAESTGQIILIILMIWFTNKIIHFIPTYSGETYHKFNELNFIIPFLIILSTMQTKLGAKLNILMDRVMNLWHGTSSSQPQINQAQGQGQGQTQGNGIRITQPLAGQQMQQQFHQPSQADYLDKTQLLPSNTQLTAMPQQNKPDFNQMYQQNNNSSMPVDGGMQDLNEPVAANGALGGMFGGSAW